MPGWGWLVCGGLLVAACNGNVSSDRAADPTGQGASGGAGGGGGGGGGGGAPSGGSAGAGATPTGAGCTLEAHGDLSPNPVALVSGPAVAATPSGFVIAWRESLPNAVALRLAVLSPAGELAPVTTQEIAACADSGAKTDVSLAFASDQGELATSVPGCGGDAGLFLAQVAADGSVVASAVTSAPDLVSAAVDRRAVAPGKNIAEWELTYTAGSPVPQASRVVVQGDSIQPGVVEHPVGVATVPYVQVATHPTQRAYQAPSGSATKLWLDSNDDGKGPSAVYDLLPASPSSDVAVWMSRAISVVAEGDTIRWLGATAVTPIALGTLPHAPGLLQATRRVHVAQRDGALFFVATAESALYTAYSGSAELFWLNGVPDREGTLGPATLPALAGFSGLNSGMAVGSGGRLLVAWLPDAAPAGAALGGWVLLQCGA